MASFVARAVGGMFDAWLGRGAYAVTVPPMDGPLMPNNDLEEAAVALAAEAPDNLVVVNGALRFSSGSDVRELDLRQATARTVARYQAPVSALAALPDGGMAVGLTGGEILLSGGKRDGTVIAEWGDYRGVCPTALLAVGDALIVAQGAAGRGPDDWCRDLIERGASGSVWRLELGSRSATCLASGLAFPSGLALHRDGGILVSESWRHRVIKLAPQGGIAGAVVEHLPGYPSRLAPSALGGYWLAVFAPRSSLIEFVLREPEFKRRMIAEIPTEYWVAPSLTSGASFLEPMQSGGIKTMGIRKPWAPTRSYGLLVRLDAGLSILASHHSRADGRRHGVTSAVEQEGTVYATSKGGGLVLSLPASEPSR
ncbi:hypothetical protein FRZ61_02720 [Hypericibacter adhaerens]|uniref:Strictosidine synthase conserved region domain-containing protein n=1 Tax=Hypericibacter adhaerens TaxID=2602016 RepID=A0A5J6MUC7_9PROT|nr:hypothetical protein [Hypericibacter adhaerens]QEX20355.1 hypothetical protein FRZ61_02720 [Hypericibacter adhaerens]